jgi:bile acid:Na+ symporter, BASS family
MDLRAIVLLTLQVSILGVVFGFGLKAAPGDVLYFVRRPALLARSLLAVFVIMPAFALALVRLFDFRPTVEVALVALAISPVPPLLPRRHATRGEPFRSGLGLMAILASVSIVSIPLTLVIIERIFGRPLALVPLAVAGLALKTVLLPLASGMAVRALAPAFAARLEKPLSLTGTALLLPASLALVAAALPAMWALIGDGTVLAMAIFVATGLGIGHALGRPNPDDAAALALSTACRHPAIAFTLLTANYPDQRFGGAILLYMLVNAAVGFPYLTWQRRRAAELRP